MNIITKDFVQKFKNATETYWNTARIDYRIYGFQFQPTTKWNDGLSDQSIHDYETDLNVQFPEELKILLRVINGTDLPTINIFGDSGEQEYSVGVYAYPKDMDQIKERIEQVKEHCKDWEFDTLESDFLFPFYGHRYIQIRDHKILRVVSIYYDDGIEYGKNLKQYLEYEFYPATAEN